MSRTLCVDEASLLAGCGVMVLSDTRSLSGWHLSLEEGDRVSSPWATPRLRPRATPTYARGGGGASSSRGLRVPKLEPGTPGTSSAVHDAGLRIPKPEPGTTLKCAAPACASRIPAVPCC
ncbi:hypothetical protein ZWY2020_020949 [Hordeum vulgare]|nr:hypothetical protein ZWY2020_020949 [Hordeum vulgare]